MDVFGVPILEVYGRLVIVIFTVKELTAVNCVVGFLVGTRDTDACSL